MLLMISSVSVRLVAWKIKKMAKVVRAMEMVVVLVWIILLWLHQQQKKTNWIRHWLCGLIITIMHIINSIRIILNTIRTIKVHQCQQQVQFHHCRLLFPLLHRVTTQNHFNIKLTIRQRHQHQTTCTKWRTTIVWNNHKPLHSTHQTIIQIVWQIIWRPIIFLRILTIVQQWRSTRTILIQTHHPLYIINNNPVQLYLHSPKNKNIRERKEK